MPKNKKRSSSSSDSDSGPDDRNPPAKKLAAAPSKKKTKDEDEGFHLGNNRFVKVREFRGKVMVDIREFYEKDGELLPGKKGIALSATQWKKFKDMVNDIDEKLTEVA
ncbi:RNA polymerase II transcriptional coactivator [Planococcus citri]|uniref:RNA polymerase II transcriptional coactivator n=1 Tax=Planococcus citri TaxID=170843 RepID=UPI0031F7687B